MIEEQAGSKSKHSLAFLKADTLCWFTCGLSCASEQVLCSGEHKLADSSMFWLTLVSYFSSDFQQQKRFAWSNKTKTIYAIGSIQIKSIRSIFFIAHSMHEMQPEVLSQQKFISIKCKSILLKCCSQLKPHPSSQSHTGRHPTAIPQRRNSQYIMKNIYGSGRRNQKRNSRPGGSSTLRGVSEQWHTTHSHHPPPARSTAAKNSATN